MLLSAPRKRDAVLDEAQHLGDVRIACAPQSIRCSPAYRPENTPAKGSSEADIIRLLLQ